MTPRRLPLILAALLASSALAVPAAVSDDGRRARPFAVADLFLELNDTDGDLGLHGALDGGAWLNLEIESPNERPLLGLTATRGLRQQGLTQLAFESAEPTFDELDPAVFFQRFPEGNYEISGRAQDGGFFNSTVALSHVLAAPAEATVSGFPAAENCDAAVLPSVVAPVVIDWNPVTTSHPDIGKAGPVVISRYQFFVEQGATKLSVDLPPAVTEFEVPAAIIAAGGTFKFEIIARTSTGNNTAIESCFVVP